ncbi:MAG: FkbM family methyltransferase [Terriglobia bacterium]|jgi:FkbM family methyltransferase
MIRTKLLDYAYLGEVFFSRLQGIAAGGDPSRNGEYQLIRTLRGVVRTAVDAGANKGDWTARVLAETRGLACVTCIEPDPLNVALLRKRFRDDGNVTIHEAALGATSGACEFWSEGVEGSGSGYVLDKRGAAFLSADPTRMCGANSQITVQQLSLDSLCRSGSFKEIDLVKCDIEGAEMSALAGAEDLFRSSAIGTLQLEYNATWIRTGYRMADLFEFASKYNYTLLTVTPWGVTRYPAYGIGLEDFRMRNLLLTRPDHVMLLKPVGPAGRARVEWGNTQSRSRPAEPSPQKYFAASKQER